MRVKTCLASIGLWGSATVQAARHGMQAFESIHSAPDGWKPAGAPNPGARLDFRIVLVPETERILEKTLQQVSDPNSLAYGQYLSQDQLRDVMRPSATGKKAVMEWLTASGISQQNITLDGNWISFSSTANEANFLLDTEFLSYRSTSKPDMTIIRTRNVFLPQSVVQYVQMVHPTTYFPKAPQAISPAVQYSRKVEDINSAVPCEKYTTPQCLRDLYKIGGVVPNNDTSGFIGIAGFLGQYPSHLDLDMMIEKTSPWAKGANYTSYSLSNGTLDESRPGAEASLDIQYTVPLTYPMRSVFYSTGGRGELVPDLNFPDQASNFNEPYLEFFKHILDQKDTSNIPHTISISYGEEEQTVPATYARTVCDQIAALAVRGVSVLSGSGDWGPGSTCQTNDGKNTSRLMPIFPASCPWTTAVGATTSYAPEQAVRFSGGGFSDLWPQPWYQKEAVDGYLSQLGDRWSGLYNPKGRGFPDIAAQGTAFLIIVSGKEGGIGGTSASTPVVASIVALLNAQRLQSGKPTLGLLNPWLYSLNGTGTTDIVAGGSEGCSGIGYKKAKTNRIPYASWNATKGWDPVTGVGTPLFDQLLKSLPTCDTIKQTPVYSVAVGPRNVQLSMDIES
ncbi:tripeptidyl-peptidase-like protein [Venturia nashicola]|nr:tripeptidyl-peptidase-like protein [Venturia nashicola]